MGAQGLGGSRLIIARQAHQQKAMLRLVAGMLAAIAVIALTVHSRGYSLSSHTFVSANMPGIKAVEEMAACAVAITTDDATFEWDATNKKGAAATTATGSEAKPIAVLAATDLTAASMMGGCKCGTAVCTFGRICDPTTSKCFLPPCPLDGLAGTDAGKKVVSDIYTAGCWCSAAGNFIEGTVGAAADIKLFPSTVFGDETKAVICKPKEFCDPDGVDTPVCTASAAV